MLNIINNNQLLLKKKLNARTYRKSPKSNLELLEPLKEIIIGSMLGDLSAERRNLKSNTRLQFKQSTVNEFYIRHLYSLFKDYCGSEPITMSKFDSRPEKFKEYSSIKYQTLSLPCFNIYREFFYDSKGIKIIPLNLGELLTPQGLAYWLMDDGYKSGKGFYICSESFTLNEHIFLINLLKSKFNLDCNYHKHTNGYRLYIFSTSIANLSILIKPYILNHFYYKFSSFQEEKENSDV
jgi:hypothetical protein